jgi:hypothetical protein
MRQIRLAGMMNRMKILSAAVILAMPLLITAQQSFNEAQVRLVITYAPAYREHSPSLECDEAMLSQRVRNGKVKWEVKKCNPTIGSRRPDRDGVRALHGGFQ